MFNSYFNDGAKASRNIYHFKVHPIPVPISTIYRSSVCSKSEVDSFIASGFFFSEVSSISFSRSSAPSRWRSPAISLFAAKLRKEYIFCACAVCLSSVRSDPNFSLKKLKEQPPGKHKKSREFLSSLKIPFFSASASKWNFSSSSSLWERNSVFSHSEVWSHFGGLSLLRTPPRIQSSLDIANVCSVISETSQVALQCPDQNSLNRDSKWRDFTVRSSATVEKSSFSGPIKSLRLAGWENHRQHNRDEKLDFLPAAKNSLLFLAKFSMNMKNLSNLCIHSFIGIWDAFDLIPAKLYSQRICIF